MVTVRMEQQGKETPSACLWMQAGVVHRKDCKLDYDCKVCRYDRSLRRVCNENRNKRRSGHIPEGKRGSLIHWKDRLQELPPRKQPCIYHMKGRIGFRSCTNAYLCSNCDFDQFFQDDYTVYAVVQPVDVFNIDGVKIPQGFYLHQGHMWAKIEEDDSVRIGLDDFALRLFGPFDRIMAPLLGKTVKQGRADIPAHRGPKRATLAAPVSGVVTAVNTGLRDAAQPVGKDPYAAGWILRVHAANLRQDLKNLMIGTETKDFLHHEIDRLQEVTEAVAGPLTADGGFMGEDIYGKMPDLGWERLTQIFLHTP